MWKCVVGNSYTYNVKIVLHWKQVNLMKTNATKTINASQQQK